MSKQAHVYIGPSLFEDVTTIDNPQRKNLSCSVAKNKKKVNIINEQSRL